MKTSPQDIQISTANLPGKLSAFIFRDAAHLSEDEPIYAINWFNTKSAPIYDFYNRLAVRSVNKVGGAPYFKGRYIKTLHGNAEDRRDVLLVVRYPTLNNFLKMLESKVFMAVSLIRMAAVKDFTFGFTKRADTGADFSPIEPDDEGGVFYGVFHYSGNTDIHAPLNDLIASADIDLFYRGKIRARVGTGETSRSATKIPCDMNGVIILKSYNQKTLENLIHNSAFNSLDAETARSFFGLYSRIL